MVRKPGFIAGLSVSAWTVGLAVGIAVAASATGFQSHDSDRAQKAGGARKSPPIPERVNVAGVENAFRLSPRLYSGGQPEGGAAFSALKELGVKNIITVDGSHPRVEEARRLGIRYVHLPVGYDGIPREQALRIIKAVTTFEGPVFVHCHHGKHRGPAAAALCGIAALGWTREQALAWLNQAGTSPDYRGLFASIRGLPSRPPFS